MKNVSVQEPLEQFRSALEPLTSSPDGMLYAETRRGSPISYFTTGTRKCNPTIDSAYSLGGYVWRGEPSEVYWTGLDPKHGCVLACWHPKKGLRTAFRMDLPSIFQIAGISSANQILLQEGFLHKNRTILFSRYKLLNLNQTRPETVTDSNLFRRAMINLQINYRALKVVQKIDPRPESGEYTLPERRYILRAVSTEGEAKILSVWENRQGIMERVSEDLSDASNWLLSPNKKNLVVAAAHRIYGEIAGIYRWEPISTSWTALKTFPDMELCWLDKFSPSGILTCVVQRGKQKRTINLSI